MASAPLPPLPGLATLDPGWVESTTPELSGVPDAALGGASTEPTSPGPPRPEPVLPEPESPEPEPTEGGGGTMLLARPLLTPTAPDRAPAAPLEDVAPTAGGGGITASLSAARREVPVVASLESDPFTDGGGGTILAASAVRRDTAEDAADADGGGGMTLAANVAAPPLRELPDAVVEGGGGTTSCVPKSFPITLLTNDVLPA